MEQLLLVSDEQLSERHLGENGLLEGGDLGRGDRNPGNLLLVLESLFGDLPLESNLLPLESLLGDLPLEFLLRDLPLEFLLGDLPRESPLLGDLPRESLLGDLPLESPLNRLGERPRETDLLSLDADLLGDRDCDLDLESDLAGDLGDLGLGRLGEEIGRLGPLDGGVHPGGGDLTGDVLDLDLERERDLDPDFDLDRDLDLADSSPLPDLDREDRFSPWYNSLYPL